MISAAVARAASDGFTLIEVLIASAIVAILAAAAIPIYSGYVEEQRRVVVKSLAETGAVSANVFYRRHGRTPTVAELNLFLSDPDRFSISLNSSWIFVNDTTVSPSISDSARFN